MVTLAGEIVGLNMTLAEARDCVEQINSHFGIIDHNLAEARKKIWELNEYKGWKVLGYDSWRQCVMEEFQKSSSTVYKQLNAALVEMELSPNGGIGAINERVLRPLTKRAYSAESRQLIWDISQDIVGKGGKVTSGVVESVVEGIADWLKSGAVQSPDGEQLPITEHLRADLTARAREVRLAHQDHIKHMGKQRDYILGGVAVAKTVLGAKGDPKGDKAVAIFPIDKFQQEKLVEMMRLGKHIFIALWTED